MGRGGRHSGQKGEWAAKPPQAPREFAGVERQSRVCSLKKAKENEK
jgi:hypothetical protein